jgi:hypothetical protein
MEPKCGPPRTDKFSTIVRSRRARATRDDMNARSTLMANTIAQEQRSYINVGQENSTPIELYYEDQARVGPSC